MISLSSISEAVKNHDDTKIFRPADYDDFMRWLDYADTEEKLFSRLGYWMVMQGLPDDRNQKYDMVRERAQELKLWNGLELKLRRWMDNSAEEFKRLGEKAYTALIGQDYASYKNNAPSEPAKALAPLCLKDIHGEDTKWLVPGVIPLGEISLLGADGGTGKGIWQAQLIAYVTTGQTSSFFPDSPQQTGKVLLMHIEDITVDGLKTAKAVFDGYSTKKDADFVEERRFKVAQTKDDTAQVILNILAESNTASMANPQLKSAVMLETECSERTYKQAYAELVKSGEIAKYQLNQKGGKRGWFTRLAYRGETDCTLTDI